MDSSVHFQSQMQHVFADMLYTAVLIWVDDVVLFADSDRDYLTKLSQFFQVLTQHNPKLSAVKSSLYQLSVTWCGRIIDCHGVRQDPDWIQSLLDLPVPRTAAEQQYFVCAVNWMRDSLLDFARVFEPLQKKLDEALKGKAKKAREAAKVDISWTPEEETAYRAALDLLAGSQPLWFPVDDATICVFTDASDLGWAIVRERNSHRGAAS